MPAATHDRCYWTETARKAPAHPALSGDVSVDVAIIGGGVVGVVTARLLKDRGLRVAVVEAGRERQDGADPHRPDLQARQSR